MTKYDIRLKRKVLSKGQIARHKDFKSLRKFDSSSEKSGSLIRIVLIVVASLLLTGMIVFGILKLKEDKPVPDRSDGMEVFDEFKD